MEPKDAWQAREMAIETWKKENPEPQKPQKQEGTTPEAARVIQHANGRVWFEAASNNGNHSFYDPDMRIELTYADDALTLDIAVNQLELLVAEFQRVIAEMYALKAEADARKQAEEAYKKAWEAWRDERSRVGTAAAAAYEAAHPEPEEVE